MATKKQTTTTADLSAFNYEVSPELLTQAIYVYQENSHRGMSKVKTRGEVNRTTKKVYKQKGTGGARHGSRSANVYVGGGVVFGPVGHKATPVSLNKKMKIRALAGILSLYKKEDRLVVVNPQDLKSQNTKEASKLLPDTKGTLSLVHFNESPEFMKAVANIKDLGLYAANRLNVYKVATSAKLALTPSAVEHLSGRISALSNKKAK